MNVLIKDMEMPKEGDFIVIRPDGKAYYVSANPQNAYERGAIPAADVRPVVRGRWIKAEYEEDDWPFPEDMFYLCSNCTTRHGFVGEQPNFCPNCGADMRAEEGA